MYTTETYKNLTLEEVREIMDQGEYTAVSIVIHYDYTNKISNYIWVRMSVFGPLAKYLIGVKGQEMYYTFMK